jgi:hypothetical protein
MQAIPQGSGGSRSGRRRPTTLTMMMLLLFAISTLYYGKFFYEQGNAATHDNNMVLRTVPSRTRNGNYEPSAIEQYVMEHSTDLGYDMTEPNKMAEGCRIWKDEDASPIYQNLQTYREELDRYNVLLKTHPGSKVTDLRLHLDEGICDTLEVHPNGLERGVFQSGSLSRVARAGLVEPILPPMRHPGICKNKKKWLMSMDYLVHDFGAMCRKLKRHSRTVFVDMGAALDFHAAGATPAVYVTHIYHKFGFRFDHIYAYELRIKDPKDVYERIPDDLKAAYHWYNVGVDADPNSPNNPLRLIKDNFHEDDFVVVKLDIDTSSIEVPMAHLLLNDETLLDLVDVFYFEHHVFFQELVGNWGYQNTDGSLEDSLKLFTAMRERGIASHSWP